MATTTVRTSEAQVARAGLAPAVRAEVEQQAARRRTPGAGRPSLWHSAFTHPEPGSPWRLTVNFNYGGPGMQLDPGDGNPPVSFTGSSMRYVYAMPDNPRGALIVARLLDAGGVEQDSLRFAIPRGQIDPPSVPAMWTRLDDWP
jgi:hypothetical protein